jgi:hypothetical protein
MHDEPPRAEVANPNRLPSVRAKHAPFAARGLNMPKIDPASPARLLALTVHSTLTWATDKEHADQPRAAA